MGKIKEVKPVKLIMGIIACNEGVVKESEPLLVGQWGDIDRRSDVIPFDFTGYYEEEMGKGLLRQWISFAGRIDPGEIAGIKIKTNQIEGRFSHDERRRINLDPGYVDGAKLVLASKKDFSHRIYLRDGIYAEVTLIYEKGKFRPLPWTYPDYQIDAALDFFSDVRGKYINE